MKTAPDPPLAKSRPPTVFKTRVFDLIDQLSGNPDILATAVGALQKGSSLIDVGVLCGAIEDDEERKGHLEEHWIGGEREQRVLSRALIRAGELALERGVPVDAYWVFAGCRLEVAVSPGPRQVTLLVVTPFPDIPTDGDAPPHPRIEIFS
jgi:hypothetical protein